MTRLDIDDIENQLVEELRDDLRDDFMYDYALPDYTDFEALIDECEIVTEISGDTIRAGVRRTPTDVMYELPSTGIVWLLERRL